MESVLFVARLVYLRVIFFPLLSRVLSRWLEPAVRAYYHRHRVTGYHLRRWVSQGRSAAWPVLRLHPDFHGGDVRRRAGKQTG